MKYYAIKHKPSDSLLPLKRGTRTGRGFTSVNPGDPGIPRLFTKSQYAKSALKWYLQGEWRVMSVHTQSPNGDDWDERWEVDDKGRKPEDFEVVPVVIYEQLENELFGGQPLIKALNG